MFNMLNVSYTVGKKYIYSPYKNISIARTKGCSAIIN